MLVKLFSHQNRHGILAKYVNYTVVYVTHLK